VFVSKFKLTSIKAFRFFSFKLITSVFFRKKVNAFLHSEIIKIIEKTIASSWDFEDEYKRLSYNKGNESIHAQENVIWVCWLQGEKNSPDIVKACIESIRKKFLNGTVIIIDEANFHDYVALPKYILSKYSSGKITKTHFSDILRWALLSRYGGYWVDATVFMTKKFVVKNDSNLVTFKHQIDDEYTYISNGRWTGFFIGVPKDYVPASEILKILYKYWFFRDELIDYFLIDYVLEIIHGSNDQFADDINSYAIFNKDLYYMSSVITEEVNDDVINRITTSGCGVFKLTYKVNNESSLSNISLFNKVISCRGGNIEGLNNSDGI